MQVPSNLFLDKIGKPALYLPTCMILLVSHKNPTSLPFASPKYLTFVSRESSVVAVVLHKATVVCLSLAFYLDSSKRLISCVSP
jgi:hypothetical protein